MTHREGELSPIRRQRVPFASLSTESATALSARLGFEHAICEAHNGTPGGIRRSLALSTESATAQSALDRFGHAKREVTMARREGFDPPTLRFEA